MDREARAMISGILLFLVGAVLLFAAFGNFATHRGWLFTLEITIAVILVWIGVVLMTAG
jgi:hypothetical protein